MAPTAHNTSQREPRRRRPLGRLRLLTVTLAGLASLSLLLCACAGTSSASTAPPAQLRAELAYARCMRAHGVTNFPDPDSQGDFPPLQTHVSKQTSNAAQHACQHLLPRVGGGGGGGTDKDQKKLDFFLEVAQCMRRHGYPTYPDPTNATNPSQGSGTRFRGTGIDTRSLQFQTEEAACEKHVGQALGIGWPGAK